MRYGYDIGRLGHSGQKIAKNEPRPVVLKNWTSTQATFLLDLRIVAKSRECWLPRPHPNGTVSFRNLGFCPSQNPHMITYSLIRTRPVQSPMATHALPSRLLISSRRNVNFRTQSRSSPARDQRLHDCRELCNTSEFSEIFHPTTRRFAVANHWRCPFSRQTDCDPR